MGTQEKARWYKKKWLVILFLISIVMYPLGLYGMWKNREFSVLIKLLFSSPLILIVLIGVFMDENEKTDSASRIAKSKLEESTELNVDRIINLPEAREYEIETILKGDIFEIFPEETKNVTTDLQKDTFLNSNKAEELKQRVEKMQREVLNSRYKIILGSLGEYDLKERAFFIDRQSRKSHKKTVKGFYFSDLPIKELSVQGTKIGSIIRIDIPKSDAVNLENRDEVKVFIIFEPTNTLKTLSFMDWKYDLWEGEYLVTKNAVLVVLDLRARKIIWEKDIS